MDLILFDVGVTGCNTVYCDWDGACLDLFWERAQKLNIKNKPRAVLADIIIRTHGALDELVTVGDILRAFPDPFTTVDGMWTDHPRDRMSRVYKGTTITNEGIQTVGGLRLFLGGSGNLSVLTKALRYYVSTYLSIYRINPLLIREVQHKNRFYAEETVIPDPDELDIQGPGPRCVLDPYAS
jgi:hypothetical protein